MEIIPPKIHHQIPIHMKQYFEFRIFLSLLFLLMLLFGCQAESNKIGVAILVDITEGCEARNLITELGIKDAFGIQDPSSFAPSAFALVTEITGVDIRPVKPFQLDGKSAIENSSLREEAVVAFVRGTMGAIRDSSNACIPTAATSIYKPLRSICEQLAKDSSLTARKIVIVTDGMENSKVSFLKESNLEKNHDKVVAKLESAYGKFPSVLGFEFILVHQPTEADGIGIKGLEFWQQFLRARGATVEIKASL